MAYLVHIMLYPIKSLDGVSVSEARITPGGALEHDRVYAIVDTQGRYVNGKRMAQVHRLRAQYDLEGFAVTLEAPERGKSQRFQLAEQLESMQGWLSGFFDFPIQIVQDLRGGFPDDTEAYGPTVIGTGTLGEVSTWFSRTTPEEMRLRFRANLEIGGVPAFWEDHLFDRSGTVVDFTLGPVHFEGVNPCQRCVVPTRHPLSGTIDSGFQKTLAKKREASLPAWAARSRFNHFYRLGINTRIPGSEAGKTIRIGDEVQILGVRSVT